MLKGHQKLMIIRITWKCERYESLKCKARRHSIGLEPPFRISKLHNHIPDPPEEKC